MSTQLPLPTSEAEAEMAIRFVEKLIAKLEDENQTDQPAYRQTVQHLEEIQALYPAA